MEQSVQDCIKDIWWQGVNAVKGDLSVRAALTTLNISPPDQIIAVGKAASAMLDGAQSVFGSDIPALVATKYDHGQHLPGPVHTIEAAHPVPDENSLLAGAALLETVKSLSEDTHLMMFVSGGASALAELPTEGMSLAALRDENTNLLAAGLDIHAMNTRRIEISQIKGGKLLAHFNGALVTVLAISDVEGDGLSVIGSGIGQAPADHAYAFAPHIVASNRIARAASATHAETLGLKVMVNSESLYTDVYDLATTMAADLRDGASGLYIWGGEPTIVLPKIPGQGGRNQALALAMADQISGIDGLAVLVAGTDGTDGPTTAAGAIVTGETWSDEARQHLRLADSGTFLDRHDALFRSGPTGTNVMDMVIAIKL